MGSARGKTAETLKMLTSLRSVKRKPSAKRESPAHSNNGSPGTPVGVFNVVAPGYVVEMYIGKDLLAGQSRMVNLVLDPTDSRVSFEEKIDARCLGMGYYAFQWLKDATTNDHIVFVLRNVRTGSRAGAAFCRVRSKSLFVDFLCAEEKRVGAGTRLVESMQEYARLRGLKYIELTSLPDRRTIDFYKKLGFLRGPPNASISDKVKARSMYRNLHTLQSGPSDARLLAKVRKRFGNEFNIPNILDFQLRHFDGVVFNTNNDEIEYTLPKYHLRVNGGGFGQSKPRKRQRTG